MATGAILTARILIVDDEVANVHLLEQVLRRAGHTNLRSTTDSRQVLALYEEVEPDLILLDLRMPHLTGFEVLDELRLRTVPGHDVPVLVLTADVTREALRAAFQAGASDFLTKPFDHDEVLLRVRNLLETRLLRLELLDQNRILEGRVRERTAQERLARERLEALSRQLVDVQEAEKRELARELHDQIGQMLTALRMALRMCMRPAPEQGKHLEEAEALVKELLERVRGLALDLRPAMLDDLGVLEALLWHFEQYTARTAVQVVLRHSGLERRFPAATETAAYRIVQEALTNVARHANVDKVEVGLWVDSDGLMVQIEDQGVGFDAEAALVRGTTTGLSGMRERATLLGGWLRITSSPGESTTLTAMLPVRAAGPSTPRPA